jgi:hypothetical protein
MNSLQAAIAQMQFVNEQQTASSLGLPRVEPTKEQVAIWARLEQHAARRGVRSFPCTPALCADWLGTVPDEGLEEACAAVQAISDSVGVSSPISSLAVRTVLERRLRTECPRSWTKQDRLAFASVPPEVRAILCRRENERDAALRTKQNKLAAEMKRLAEAEPKKEAETNEQS